MVQLRPTPFIGLLQSLAFILGSMGSGPALAGSDFTAILAELNKPETSAVLVNYFKQFPTFAVLRQSDDLSQFSTYLQIRSNPEELRQRISKLRRYERDLPHPLRWLLVAAELSMEVRSLSTVRDAEAALRNMSHLEGMSFITRKGHLLPEIRVAESSQLRVPGYNMTFWFPERVISLFVNLHKAWDGNTAIAPSEVEKLRLDIYRMLLWHNAPFSSQVSTMQFFLKEMHDSLSAPSFQFHNKTHRHEAFRYIEMIAREFGDEIDQRGNQVDEKTVERYKDILRIGRKFIGSDIEYVLKNYTSLKYSRLISLTEVLKHKVTKDAVEPLATLLSSRKLSTDHFVIGTTLGLWQDPKIIRVHGLPEATRHAVRAVLNGQPDWNFVRIGMPGQSTENIVWDEYISLVTALFEGIAQNISVHPELAETAKFMLKTPTPSLGNLKGPALDLWKRIELKRIQAAKRVLPESEFIQALVSTVMDLDQHWRFQGVASAYFLNEVLTVDQRRQISTQVVQLALQKRKAIGIDPQKSQQDWAAYAQAWEQDQATLVYIIKYLDPSNPDLILYLSKCVTMSRVEGPLGSRRCLAELTELRAGTRELQDYLRGQLMRVGHGDPASDFRTYLRIFPTDALGITQALGAYRRGIESPWTEVKEALTKIFREMIMVLVAENAQNPEIIGSIHSNPEIPALDQRMIESIVKTLINGRNAPAKSVSCAGIANTNQGAAP